MYANFVYSPFMVYNFMRSINVKEAFANVICIMYMFVYCYRLILFYFECFFPMVKFSAAFIVPPIPWLHKKHHKTQKSMKTSQKIFLAKNFENLFVFLHMRGKRCSEIYRNQYKWLLHFLTVGRKKFCYDELSTCNFDLVKVLLYFVFLLCSRY